MDIFDYTYACKFIKVDINFYTGILVNLTEVLENKCVNFYYFYKVQYFIKGHHFTYISISFSFLISK